jgi:hypothetical protein
MEMRFISNEPRNQTHQPHLIMVEQLAIAAPKDEKHSMNWGALILWPVVVLILYILSTGPVAMMEEKGRISHSNEFMRVFYMPWTWAYKGTPLHKPLGLYLHLWLPKHFDKKGDMQ